MTTEILTLINQRDFAYKLYNNCKTGDNFEVFKSLRNKTQTKIQQAKQNFFTEQLEENKNDSRALWQHLKCLDIPSKKGPILL